MDLANLLSAAVGLLHGLLSLAAVVVCALHLGRSRWVAPLLAGFLVETVVSVGYRAATWALGSNVASYQRMGLVFAGLSLVGLLGRAAIVVGLAGLLRERAAEA